MGRRYLVALVLGASVLAGCATVQKPIPATRALFDNKERVVAVAIEKMPEPGQVMLGNQGLLDIAINRANAENGGRVVTSIEPLGEWYPAEDYHQDYWAGEGQRNPYCLAVIPPKLQKLRKSFQARTKSAAATA